MESAAESKPGATEQGEESPSERAPNRPADGNIPQVESVNGDRDALPASGATSIEVDAETPDEDAERSSKKVKEEADSTGAVGRTEPKGARELRTQFSLDVDVIETADSPGSPEGQPDGRTSTDFERLASRSVSQFSIRAVVTGDVDLSWHDVSVVLPTDPNVKRFDEKIILNKGERLARAPRSTTGRTFTCVVVHG